MPLSHDLYVTSITLPLDAVLAAAKAAKGKLDEETEALLKIEIASVLSYNESLEDEVIRAILRDTFGEREGA